MGGQSLIRAQTRMVSTASCAPPSSGRPSTTTSSLLPSATAPGRARSRSRTNTLVVTRPPPSRQMRAATLSRAHLLLRRTPALAHAARWWPKESNGRPHLQETLGEGKGATGDSSGGPTEELGFQPRDPASGATRKSQSSSGPLPGTAPRPQRCQPCWRTCLRPSSTPRRAAILRCPTLKIVNVGFCGLAPSASALQDGGTKSLTPFN